MWGDWKQDRSKNSEHLSTALFSQFEPTTNSTWVFKKFSLNFGLQMPSLFHHNQQAAKSGPLLVIFGRKLWISPSTTHRLEYKKPPSQNHKKDSKDSSLQFRTPHWMDEQKGVHVAQSISSHCLRVSFIRSTSIQEQSRQCWRNIFHSTTIRFIPLSIEKLTTVVLYRHFRKTK